MHQSSSSASSRTPLHTEVVLGKSNSADTGYLSAYYDDVSIGYDKDDMVIIQAGCYETAMIIYTLSMLEVPIWQPGIEAISDRYGNTGSAMRLMATVLDVGEWGRISRSFNSLLIPPLN